MKRFIDWIAYNSGKWGIQIGSFGIIMNFHVWTNFYCSILFAQTNQRLEQQQLGVKHSFSSLFMYSGVNCFVCLFFLFIYWGYFECPKECEWESVTAWKKKDKMHTYENTRKRMCVQCAFANYIDGECKKRRRGLIFPWIFFKRLHTIRFLNLLFAL